MNTPDFNPATILMIDEHLSDEQLEAIVQQSPVYSTRRMASDELTARRKVRVLTRARNECINPLRERVLKAQAKNQVELHLDLDVIEILLTFADEAMRAWKIDPKGT